MSLEKDFLKAIQTASTPKTSAYDTAAKVVRVDGSRVWVHIDGGASETPVERTIDCAVGDTVRIRLSGGEAYIIGNNSAPPTDDTTAILARDTANTANILADTAKRIAGDAQESATIAAQAAAQAEQDASAASAAAAVADGKAVAAANAASAAQSSATAAQNSADAAAQAASVADGKAVAAGNAASAAQSSANAAQASADNAGEYASRALGNLSTVQSVAETLTWITQHGTMTLTTDTALDPTHVYFVVDANGDYIVGGTHYSVVTEPDVADISTYYELSIDESLNNYVATHLALDSEGLWIIPVAGGFKVLIATGAGSTYTTAGTYIVDGNGNTIGQFSTGGITLGSRKAGSTIGTGSQVYGVDCEASGSYSHAEGYQTVASAFATHAEGENTKATNMRAHAEGFNTTASGIGSHAEGQGTTASGNYSHAEGEDTVASGSHSHAMGRHTRTPYIEQVAIGAYNYAASRHAFMIGNGLSDSNRHNAFAVRTDGTIEMCDNQVTFVVSNGAVCIGFDDGI